MLRNRVSKSSSSIFFSALEASAKRPPIKLTSVVLIWVLLFVFSPNILANTHISAVRDNDTFSRMSKETSSSPDDLAVTKYLGKIQHLDSKPEIRVNSRIGSHESSRFAHSTGKISISSVFEHYWQWLLGVAILVFLLVILFLRTLLFNSKLRQIELELKSELEDKRRSEKALLLSDDILSKVANLVIVADPNGFITYVSPSVKDILGFEVEEVLGDGWWNLTSAIEEERKKHKGDVLEGAHIGKGQYITKKNRKDGSSRWILWNDSMAPNGQVIGVGVDITARKQAESKYAQQSEFLQGVLESLTHPFYIIDVNDYTVTMANSASGFGDLSNNPTCYELVKDPDKPCSNARSLCPIEMIKKTHKPFTYERKTIQNDSGEHYVEVHGYPLFNDSGELTHVIEYSLDVTERKLAEKEMRKFSHAIQQSPNSIIITDTEGRIELANPKFYETTGFIFENIVSKNAVMFDCAKKSEDECRKIWETVSEGKEWSGELFKKRKNGEIYYESAKISPIRNNEGEIINFLKVSEDITERKRAREALQLSDDILGKVGNIILVGNESGEITFVSPSVKEILGYEPSECLGDQWWHLTRDDPELREQSRNFWIEAARKKNLTESGSYINMIKHKDGSPRWILWNDSQGQDGSLISVGIDDTNRRNTENELRKLSHAVEQSPSSIVITDVDGDIEYANPKFLDITGYEIEEVIGRNPRFLKSGELEEEEYAKLWNTISSGGEWRGEFHNKKKNGQYYWEFASISPIRNEDGDIVYYLKVSEDITERKKAESALIESEGKYRNLVERANDGILVIQDSLIKLANPRIEEITGYTVDELRGSKFQEYLSPEEVFKVVQMYMRLMTKDIDSVISETIVKRKDGMFRDIEFNANRLPYQSSEAAFVIVRDITARKIADNALRDSESKFRTLFNSLHDVIFVCDSEGTISEINPSGGKLLGYTREELIGMKISELLFKPSDKNLLLKKAAKAGELKDHHIFLLKNDGTKLQAIISITIKRDEETGEVVLYQGTIRDLTKLKRVEHKLRKALQENEQLFNSISSILIQLDSNGIITKLNKAAQDVLGIITNEAVGRPLQECDISWDGATIYQGIFDSKSSQTTVRLNSVRFTRQDGTEGLMGIVITPVKIAATNNVGCILLINDLTEQKIMESQLAQAQKLESIGQLAAGIAHEINTPTQFIGDNARFLQKAVNKIMPLLNHCELISQNGNSSNNKKEEFFSNIQNHVEKINLSMLIGEIPYAIEDSLEGIESVTSIVQAMKKFSHPGVQEKTATNINEALESVITISKNEWKYVAEVETEFDATLPAVECYPGELNQVFLNLIINSAHAIADNADSRSNKKGLIQITTRQLEQNVEIAISDNGSGIPEEVQSRIFDPFFTTKDVGEGTGQGLAISHAVVVDKHDGTITFDSEQNKGTSFYIRLPINLG